MAQEHLKSAQITNAEAIPAVLNPAYQDGGRVRVKRAYRTNVLAVSDAGSTYRFFRVRSSDMMKALVLENATLGAACTGDIGLYRTTKDGGAVVDADFFASAFAMTANLAPVSVMRESGILTLPNAEKRIWEALGLTADPMLEYDVAITLVVASSAVGGMLLTGEVVGGH